MVPSAALGAWCFRVHCELWAFEFVVLWCVEKIIAFSAGFVVYIIVRATVVSWFETWIDASYG